MVLMGCDLWQVWSFFDPENNGYVESSGLSEELCMRLGGVEPTHINVSLFSLTLLERQSTNPTFHASYGH